MFVAAFNDEDPGVLQIAQRCTLPSFFPPNEVFLTASDSLRHCTFIPRCGARRRHWHSGD